MKVLAAENSTSYAANNTCKIYIIKQVELGQALDQFKADYADLLSDSKSKSKLNKILSIAGSMTGFVSASAAQHEVKISLTPLICYDDPKNDKLYSKIAIKHDSSSDNPDDAPQGKDAFWFLTSLFELRNCPILDFSKPAFVFQIEGQSKGGLANVVSLNTNFSVNGQSSAEVILNNRDFLYNFKQFSDESKYTSHLKSYFDPNDIIIIRYQKKNTTSDSLLNSFKNTQIDYWKDPYIGSEYDAFTTIFTGYINDINNTFSFSNGQQTVTLSCTGPSKKLTWTRVVTNIAAASKDSASAVTPMTAFMNPQTRDEKGNITTSNADVIKNLILRTYSGVLNVPEVKNAYIKFVENFDKTQAIQTDEELRKKQLDLEKLNKDREAGKNIDERELANARQAVQDRETQLRNACNENKNAYNNAINKYMNSYSKQDDSKQCINIIGYKFIDNADGFGGSSPIIFKIDGTDQPAYQLTFANFSNLFQSDFSTAYQFIKSIADNLQFNFYDDPYGTIHFGVPNFSLMHLNKPNHPNNLNQLVSFSESQNTENIANVQYATASYEMSSVDLSCINTIIKDYRSIQQFGEKMMQPFTMPGIKNPAGIKYAAKMKMAKYNRKALSNIRVQMQGEPCLMLDEYAYIKSLRKLFYIESYSHSYTAGDSLTTSLNGTYTRDILGLLDITLENKSKKYSKELSIAKQLTNAVDRRKAVKRVLEKMLQESSSVEDVIKTLDNIKFANDEKSLQTIIYEIYVTNWGYPEDNTDLQQEIASMYNYDSLRQCYLDGFFWAIPFDVNPYFMAIKIQEEEKQNIQQLQKTINKKTSTEKRTIKQVEEENISITGENSCPNPNVSQGKDLATIAGESLDNMTKNFSTFGLYRFIKKPFEITAKLKADKQAQQEEQKEEGTNE